MEAANVRFAEEEDVKYMEYATRYDIVRYVTNTLFENGWKTSFDYLKYQPKIFTDKALVTPAGTKREFLKYLDYCYLLSRNFTDKDEAARYKGNEGISIYFSVVLYWLLAFYGVVNEKKLRYCQGYFRYKLKDSLRPSPRYRAGMHAWLCYNDSVIDITIWQQEGDFAFPAEDFNLPVILGKIPDGLGLIGFPEDRSLVKEYARRFAKESGLTFCQWLDYHKNQADLLFKARTEANSPEN